MTQVIDGLTLTFVGTPIQGEAGADGKSAYQSYVETTSDNPVLSEADWIASIGTEGKAGADGKSAYQSYLDTTTDNPKKSELDWIASLKGEDGVSGSDGKSSYQSYLDTTSDDPKLTETQWVASLVGPKGDKGDPGANGENGANGRDGVDGKDGKDGADGTGLTNRQSWVSGTTYNPSDYVFANNSSGNSSMWILSDSTAYVSTIDPKDDLDHWIEFQAPAGKDGKDGTNGVDGKDGTNGTNGVDGADGKDGVDGKDGNGIASSEVVYQSTSSGTTIPTGTWVTTPPSVNVGWYLWTRITFTMTDGTVTTAYSVGYKGATGAAGRGISTTAITYQASTSGTVAPTGTWSTSVPTVTQGQYLWTRTLITYTNTTTSTSYSVAYHAIDGSGGSGGTGTSITGSDITYQAGTSGVDIPAGSWSGTIPTVAKGEYLWTKVTFNLSDGSSSTAYSVSYHGLDGSNGTDGINGTDGKDGATGVGILTTSVTYQAGESGTTAPTGSWVTTIPDVTEGQYLWTKTLFTYSDNTTATAYSVSYRAKNGTAADVPDTLILTTDPTSSDGIDGSVAIVYPASGHITTWAKTGGVWAKVWEMPLADTAAAQAATSSTIPVTPAGVREYMEQYGIAASYTPTASNLNDVVKGVFFNYSTSTANYPGTSGYGRGISIPSGSGYVTQFAIENDSGKMFIRYQTNGTWGSWISAGGSSTTQPVFATTTEAIAASSADTMMSPVRTKEYLSSVGIGDTYINNATDLNSVMGSTDRTVFFTYTAATTNIPVSGSYGRGMMIAGGGNYTTQLVWVNGTNDQYVRFNNGGSWESWVKQGFNENDLKSTAWYSVTPVNGWYVPEARRAVIRKVLGIVFLEINIAGGNIADGTTLFSIPDEYLAPYSIRLLAFSNAGTGTPITIIIDVPNKQAICSGLGSGATAIQVNGFYHLQ